MLQAREEFGLALSPCQAYVFAFGGYDKVAKSCLTSVERYVIADNYWERVVTADLYAPLKSMATATMPDGIYLIGGYDTNKMTYARQVLRLDTKSLEWQQMTDMKVARGALTACSTATCDYIYAVGGFTNQGTSTQLVERFNVQQNRWEMVAPLTTPRFAHAACLTTIVSNNQNNEI